MLKQTLVCTAIIASIFGSPIIASAAEYGTAEGAKTMLDRAIAAVMTDKSGAINKFNYNDPKFRDRDLFVFCFNGQDGKYTAHEAMVGRDVRAFRDAKGQPFGQQMYEIATEGEILSVDYFSPVPGLVDLAYKRAYARHRGVGAMTEWRQYQATKITPEARTILEAAGFGKQKYFIMVGGYVAEEQVGVAKEIISDFGKGNKIVQAFFEATLNRRKQFERWFFTYKYRN